MSFLAHPPSTQDSRSSKSLTPQRKHRKLLKDGSGAEVWPESIEKIFVQGLREYWNSPYATYPQSRGRSRWRNQFLVEYLQKHNILRSKKQVASHIQVLRNMWKGEPEYQLVAGGEELAEASPPAGSNIKLEDQPWANTAGLLSLEFDDNDGYSSNSASPDFSPPDFQTQFLLPSPDHPPSRQLELPLIPPQGMVAAATSYNSTSIPSSTNDYSTFGGAYDRYGNITLARGTSIEGSSYPKSRQYSNRICALRLTADGMSSFTIRTDALIASNMPYEPLQLKIRLSIPTVNVMNRPPALCGFLAGLSLSHIWTSSKCVTKTIVDNTTISEDVGELQVSDISSDTVNAIVPDSHLTRCLWLDHRSHTTITQEFIIDNVSLLFVIYELERTSGNPMPSAQFTGFLKYPSRRSNGTSPSPSGQSSSTGLGSNLTSGRYFSTPTGSTSMSASSCGFSTVLNPPSHHHLHQSGSVAQSAQASIYGSGASGLSTYSPTYSQYSRHSNQTLANALTPPLGYPMATSLSS